MNILYLLNKAVSQDRYQMVLCLWLNPGFLEAQGGSHVFQMLRSFGLASWGVFLGRNCTGVVDVPCSGSQEYGAPVRGQI